MKQFFSEHILNDTQQIYIDFNLYSSFCFMLLFTFLDKEILKVV